MGRDLRGRRILIEGVSHRYVIRGCDVVEVEPLAGNTASARVTYRIGEQAFGLVINRYSAWVLWIAVVAALPLIGLPMRPLSHRMPKAWARRLNKVLRP